MMKSKIFDSKWYDQVYSKNYEDFSCWNKKILEILLKKFKKRNLKILDLGCGKGFLLKKLHIKLKIPKKNLYGVDQSKVAIKQLINDGFFNMFAINVGTKKLPFKDNFFDIIIMAEVIEHLRKKDKTMKEVKRIMKNKGTLILSFPNYLNFPWLVIRLMAEKFKKPEWINLQPCDKIYNYIYIKKYLNKLNFKFLESYGTNYFPPKIYKYESLSLSNLFTKIGLSFISFHPILVFKNIK